ncbi:ArnT family glycosyltransferase [Nocardioides taihuensis]|uniref:ArnT family glycosyltransferase n=1 Tax=Nocardioides taihuensis TaxID=1835606 RepID=A0ABW0BNY5_9ACTN
MTTSVIEPAQNRSADGGESDRPPTDDPRWARPAFWALLAGTAVLYVVGLSANGYANSFYSAAAQAGSQSWSALFYGALDAAGSITVDKPPASLWVMGLSVRAFGLGSWSILLPEVLMGLATVAVVHAGVKRVSGAVAGLLAGLVLALTPVAVLMFRFNNPDALLTLLMAVSAYATLRAVERGSLRWLALGGVLVGLGFLTKTLQVGLVVPGFAVAWLLAAQATVRRRLLGCLAWLAAFVVSAGWWVAVVELVPASSRPYIGGSQTNSFLELTFGYNGLGRLSGDETGSVGGGGGWGETGLGRMFSDSVGGQVSWLLPAALLLLVAGLVLRGRAPRTDLRRAAYVVWGGWLLVTGLTFSLMAGIFHEYYTVALAPAIAALVGMGAAEAWERRATWAGRVLLAAAVLVSALWSVVLLGRTDAYGVWLPALVGVAGLAGAAGLLVGDRLAAGLGARAVTAVVAASLLAVLAGPAAYTATTVSQAHTGSIVTAGPTSSGGPGGGLPGGGLPGGRPPTGQAPTGRMPVGQTPMGQPPTGGAGGLLDASTPSDEVVALLTGDAGDHTWVAAAVGSQSAAGLQLGTGEPVMAIGGFNGSDPSPTLAEFQQLVADGEVHWFAAGASDDSGAMGPGAMGGSGAGSEITAWVEESFIATTVDGQTFYDLSQAAS